MPAQAVYAGVPQAPWSPHSTYIVELVQVDTCCWPQRGVNPTDHLNLESVHKLPLQQYAEPMLLGALCGPGREGASTGDLREGRGPHLSCAPPRPGAAAPHLRPVFAHCSRPKAVLRCYRCVAGGHHTGQTLPVQQRLQGEGRALGPRRLACLGVQQCCACCYNAA